MNKNDLIKKAREAYQHAYAPYSGFKVGAALLTGDGSVYTGTNVENVSYGLTICAERVAVFKAISDAKRDFNTIAIAGSGKGYIYPCGACLQVLAEFSRELTVIVTNGDNNEYREFVLKELLPQGFVLPK